MIDVIHLSQCKVFHGIFVFKLERHGLDRWATQWIRNWLTSHTQRVVVNVETRDEWCSLEAVLELTLLNFFIGNMGGGNDHTLLKFAKNMKLCGTVYLLEQRNTIQKDADRLKTCIPHKVQKCEVQVLHLGPATQEQIQSELRMD